MSMVGKARRSAGLTQSQAAGVLGVSSPTYIKKEKNPRKLRFGEFKRLAEAMDPMSRGILWRALEEVEASPRRDKAFDDMTIGEWYGSRGDRALAAEFDAMRRNFFAGGV